MPHIHVNRSYACEVCILAGGLSSRMGRDKGALTIGGKPLLSHVRAAARSLGIPVRVIRRDLVPRCGPLGGVYTALKTTHADSVLFMSCDMPFVSKELLEKLRRGLQTDSLGVFAEENGHPGFPFLLRTRALGEVELLLAQNRFSLGHFAMKLNATRVGPLFSEELFNINTRPEWLQAREIWRSRRKNAKQAFRRVRRRSEP